jgi:hydrophobic/amphiphilic exporter-1 (mainly G- bacteria), HAE1 family
MNLPEIAIRKPVFALMLSLVLVIFGVISYFRIGIQETPNINYPVITISTSLPGGAPKLIADTVTKPIEKDFNTISGVKTISSTTTQGSSSVQLTFFLGTDMSKAFNQVQSKVNKIQGTLPPGTKPPSITRVAEGASPIMLIAVYGNRTISQLDDIARNVVEPRLQTVPGVGQVSIQGVGKQIVKVTLSLGKMAAMKITPGDIQNAFSTQHVNEPGGFIVSDKKQYILDLNLEVHTLNDLKGLIVTYREGAPIYLRDVATVTLGVKKGQQLALFKGQETVGVSVVKKGTGNTVAIAKAVDKELQTVIKPQLPVGVHVATIFNESTYIKSIVQSLEMDAWLSILAAALVIFLFLKSLRSTMIIVTAIPVSLLGVVMVIYFFGYTFNIITLLGIILLVGVVVDDSIVMLENIYRQGSEFKLKRIDAALTGSKQVVFAVLASSLTLVSIFVPVIFMGGIVGLFFKSFAIVVTMGVLISLFVSLTLTPMLCSRWLKFDESQSWLYQFLEKGFVFIDKVYHAVLRFALRFRWVVIILALIAVLASIPLLMAVNKAFLPAERNSGHFSINIQTPQGSSVKYTQTRVNKVEAVLRKYPEVKNYYSSISPANIGNITVKLVPRNEQAIKQTELMALLRVELKDIPGTLAFVSGASGGAGAGTSGTSISFAVTGKNYDDTVNNSVKFLHALLKEHQLSSVYIHLASNQPTYKALVDRNLASSLGISPKEIASALSVLGGGARIGKFNKKGGGERYDIVLQTEKGEFTNPRQVSNIYLQGKKGALVRLDTIASLESTVSPVKITRRDLNYSVTFSATSKLSLNKAIALIKTTAQESLPKAYTLTLTGNASSFQSTIKDLGFSFALIILLMYMVLASQFNSFIQPLIVLVAQPLAIIGGLLTLWMMNQSLNIYSMIGVLLLMGLVAKNSILLIDLTNQCRKDGMPIKEALLTACPRRMRPVVMTSLAIIFAMLPSAFAMGPDSSSHQPLSLVIIGGMISSTLLTLVVVPALYSLVENGLQRFNKDMD